MSKFLNFLRDIPLINGDSSLAQLIRTYIVGVFNLLIGLLFNYIFQFLIFNNIAIPLRTYLTNVGSFSIGVVISYFLSRRIIFKLSSNDGNFKEFINFVLTNLINLILPLIIWYLIDIYRPSIQESEIQFLIATVLIASVILPIKYVIYRLFVFKDSLDN
ncbi:GtrA family protein [Acidimicrobiia bacterium]|nr:GtrA family protein [Acidimicrobiia bacterium]